MLGHSMKTTIFMTPLSLGSANGLMKRTMIVRLEWMLDRSSGLDMLSRWPKLIWRSPHPPPCHMPPIPGARPDLRNRNKLHDLVRNPMKGGAPLSGSQLFSLQLDGHRANCGQHPILGFGGHKVAPMGVIRLPLRFGDKARSRNLEVDFLVVVVAMAYNVILGCPTLYTAKAIIAPYILQILYEDGDGSVAKCFGDQGTRGLHRNAIWLV
ncbi:hypothetical protein Cgig2_009778 [Carnegiea gigantea]|uniref:Uncharacterized protein n=1 Tax=Carnegiea gigantea TaxID=171969 RepID=A0A9Q1Q4F2_9CARY|nr:hypothetical protein Cgig2_009778 [Carnegiea gigantea]